MLLLEIFKNMSITESFVMMLNEGKIETFYTMYKDKLEDRFDNDNRVPASMKSRLSQGEDQAKNIVDMFAEIDPTRKKSNLQWMIIQYLKGEPLEDIEHAKRALVTLDKFKSKMTKNQIGQFKSIGELNAAVEEVAAQKDFKDLDNIPTSEATYVIKSKDFKVIIPKDHAASCKYGASGFCTTNEDPAFYNQYAGAGNLYIIMVGAGKNPELFQLQYEKGEFKNKWNKNLTPENIDLLSSYPKYKDFLNMLIKKHYSKYFK